MPYCVKCGVELAESEKACPLCDTPVMLTDYEYRKPEHTPYPTNAEQIFRHVDIKFGVWLAALILCVPCSITLLCNFLINREISWSLYVVGACACVFVWVLVPIRYYRLKVYWFIAFDCAALLLYLLLICRLTSGLFWYLPLALPIVCATGALGLFIFFIYRRKSVNILRKIAYTLFSVGLFTAVLELILDIFIRGELYFSWSPYVVTSLGILGLVFLILNKRRRWREEIRRRLFF